eukprot:8448632-Lingulodinium_polyedra.AAC.1
MPRPRADPWGLSTCGPRLRLPMLCICVYLQSVSVSTCAHLGAERGTDNGRAICKGENGPLLPRVWFSFGEGGVLWPASERRDAPNDPKGRWIAIMQHILMFIATNHMFIAINS